MLVDYIKPVYGKNYDRGFVFGTNKMDDFVHAGIAYFQRWERMDILKCQHVGLVVDENTIIQAHVGIGVHEASISTLFDDPCTQVFFRKPKGLTSEMANRIVGTASMHLGQDYDKSLILAHAANGTFLGRLASKMTDGASERALCEWLDDPFQWICSELVADALDTQPELKDQGILALPDCAIKPQELISDEIIYEQWKDGK